jgi:UDP-glucuronate 4-epimerase
MAAYDVRLKEWRLRRLQKEPRFTSRRCDIADRQALEELFRNRAPDGVINLAARVSGRQIH